MSNISKLDSIKFDKNIMLGCDPEFFFANNKGEIVGSEKILTNKAHSGHNVVIDGVQAELNPSASYCREVLAASIQGCFLQIRDKLQELGTNISVKVDTLVDVSESELNSLSKDCQVFGCAPSTNVYIEGDNKTSEIKVDPKKYLKRSAGGHIHMGNAWRMYLSDYNDTQLKSVQKTLTDIGDKHGEDYDYQRRCYKEQINSYKLQQKTHQELQPKAKNIDKALKEMPEVMVPILDIIVGNTCVLLDRSAGNAERRSCYGRAGEFRIKPYGIEYRTLSNFWLRSYQLMSFVTGLCRFAVHVVSKSTPENDYVKAFFDAVPREDIVKAINENDRDLALQNFKKIQDIFSVVADEDTGRDYYPIRKLTMKAFYHFILRIKQKGLEYWFPADVITHWCGNYLDRGGWETFANNTIVRDLNKYTIDLNKKKKETEVAVVS